MLIGVLNFFYFVQQTVEKFVSRLKTFLKIWKKKFFDNKASMNKCPAKPLKSNPIMVNKKIVGEMKSIFTKKFLLKTMSAFCGNESKFIYAIF